MTRLCGDPDKHPMLMVIAITEIFTYRLHP
mgnify:CR=1 FL=1